MTTHASTEDERLIFGTPGNGRNSQASDGESTPTQANYGSLLERDLSTRKDDDRLDGNDADVWQNVPSHWPNSVGRNQDQCSSRSRSRPQSVFSCQPLKQVDYSYLKMIYLLVPFMTVLSLVALALLARYGWPPNKHERDLPLPQRPAYPHTILLRPVLLGMSSSISIAALRTPIVEAIDIMTPTAARGSYSGLILAFLGIAMHTALQESSRIAALYILDPAQPGSTTTISQLFQQSYYLGLGWGLAEAFWGIVRAWFSGMRLYGDLLQGTADSLVERGNESDSDGSSASSLHDEQDNLLCKIANLKRLRGRRDLENALGVPFPNISLAVHILWRLDTLLLNLGLTLVASAFYYNTAPIYRRIPSHHNSTLQEKIIPKGVINYSDLRLHHLFPLVVFGLFAIHLLVSSIWAVGVRRVGLSAVTWASLIISLGSVFAGLGCWGGLV